MKQRKKRGSKKIIVDRSKLTGVPCLSQTRKGNAMKMHKSLTAAKIIMAVQRWNTGLDNPGFCIACGNEQEGCEPDAREYECEACGEKKVYGASELLMEIM